MTQLSTHSKQKSSGNEYALKLVGLILLLIIGYCATAQNMLVGLTSNGGPAGKGTAFSISTTGTNFSVIKGFADWGSVPNGSLLKDADGNFYGMTSKGGTFNYGTIFKMTPAGNITIMKQFNYSVDGGYPEGELIKGTDGDFYGLTVSGGTTTYGTIFKISASGIFTVLKNFEYGTDGGHAYGHLTLATDGNYYGITYSGGANGAGTIFKFTPAGVYSVIHHMNKATDGGNSYSSLTEGTDGNLYGTTYYGGANNAGTIFKVTKTGTLTVLKNFNGSTDGYNCKSDLIQATDGSFYGTCYSGGTNSAGTIFKLKLPSTYSVIKNFIYSTDGGNPYGGLFQNSDGNFYGITCNGGAKGGGTAYKLTQAGVYSVIHPIDYTTEGNISSSVFIKGNDANLYALASGGGMYNIGTAFKITTSGAFTKLADFNGSIIGNAPYSDCIKGADSAYYCTTSGGGAYNYGSIVKICGGVATAFYSFQSANGRYPKGKLLLANDGNFYGTASSGGINGLGTIFKITPGGVFSVLHDFKTADGTNPLGSLIQATDGNLYGLTSSGGASGSGTIFKVSLAGTFTVLKNFVSSTDGSTASGSLLQANDGNFYGMTSSNGKIFKLTSSNVFSILHSFSSSVDGYIPLGSLIQGIDGNLYGTCSDGGTNSAGTIFQVSLSGSYKVLRHLMATNDGRMPKGSLLQGNDGMLYGVTSIGGTYNAGTVFKISTYGSYTVLHHMNIITDGGIAYGSLVFAPVNNLVANAQSVSLNEDSTLKIGLKGSGGSPLTYNITSAPQHGKLSGTGANRTYKPNNNYNGPDQFSFNVSIGCIASTPAIISINIKPLPDSPVLAPIGNKTVMKDSTLSFKVKATDADKGQEISYSLIGAPAGAKVNKTSGAFTFTPTATGTYTFKVRATDNDTPSLYDEERITVTVTGAFAFLNADARNIDSDFRASIFPNPADNKLNITVSDLVEKIFVRVVDLNGKIVLNKTFSMQGSNTAELNVSALARGFYILQFQAEGHKQDLKFIKK